MGRLETEVDVDMDNRNMEAGIRTTDGITDGMRTMRFFMILSVREEMACAMEARPLRCCDVSVGVGLSLSSRMKTI